MALILFDRDAVIDFIPEWNGNRDSDTPFIVKLKYVGWGKQRGYAQRIAQAMKSCEDEGERARKILDIQNEQFIENVVGFENCNIGGKDSPTPEEFYDLAAPELVQEIIEAMQSHQALTGEQRKN